MSFGPRTSRKRARPDLFWPVFVLVFVGIVAAMIGPSFLYVEKASAERPDLIYEGRKQTFPIVVERNEAYVPFDFIEKAIDPDAFWDESGIVIVTTKDKVIKLKTDSLTGYVNRHPVDLRFPVILEKGHPYVPAATLEILYPLSTEFFPEEGVFMVKRNDVVKTVGTAAYSVIVRVSPSRLAKRVGIIDVGTSLDLYDSRGGWIRVETPQGIVGWIPEKSVSERRQKEPDSKPPQDYLPPPLSGGKIALVWEQVERFTPNPSEIGPMGGVNVVSPTWFRLGESPGEVENYADPRYVAWAHERGYKVWALFSNSFDLERTRAVLRDSELRDKVISQMLLYARMYSLDGINLDFENVYKDDAAYLTQFVREMTPLLHEMDLIVSIDVTVKSLSPTWSMCYERKRLAETVDYVMLMAYDEYPAGSKTPGPTSSIPWTIWTVETTLQEVPAEKLVLGVPFYTRIWTEVKDDSGVKVTQRAVGMRWAEEWLKDQGIEAVLDSETGLRYAEIVSDHETLKLWLEDSDSMRKRMEIAKSYGLAGIAAWRRGFESEAVWDTISDYLNP